MGERMMKEKGLRILFAVMMVTVSVTGWAYASHCVDLLKNGTLTLEPVSSKGYYVSKVHINQVDDGIKITGKVKRRSHAGIGGGHIDITITSPQGEVLETLSTSYSPRIIPMRRMYTRESNFEVSLPMIPPKGSMIVVAHHKH